MTQLPLSNILMGAGMACISPHRGGLDFFLILSVGCASHFEASLFCSGTSEMYARVLYTLRSRV
jgi:hypothetical protein